MEFKTTFGNDSPSYLNAKKENSFLFNGLNIPPCSEQETKKRFFKFEIIFVFPVEME